MEPTRSKCLHIPVLRDLPFSVVPWAIICLCPDAELALCDFSQDFPPTFFGKPKIFKIYNGLEAQNAGPPKLSHLKNQKPAAGSANIAKNKQKSSFLEFEGVTACIS